MLNRLKKDNKGFTIIEVMIVLAIAGLILAIVLLVVPQLQRNARNTSRRNDAANIAGGINEFVSNNNGSLPSTCSGTDVITWGGGTATATTNAGYYKTGCAQVAATSNPATGSVQLVVPSGVTVPADPAVGGSTPKDSIWVLKNATCNANNNATAPGTARSFAVVFQIETGPSSFAEVCIAS